MSRTLEEMNADYAAANHPYGVGKDALSDPDGFEPEEKEDKPIPQPSADHNVRINPYAGQGRVTSSTQEQTGKPVFFNNGGQIFDAAKINEHTNHRADWCNRNKHG